MPIQTCQFDGDPGWQCGDAGFCYTYPAGDDEASLRAKKKAIAQCLAMGENPSRSGKDAMSETKALHHVEIKDADQGTVQAAIATLNVIDHDGDVTLPGAFKTGQEVVIGSYNHASYLAGAPPVGKGVIREDGDTVYLEGKFFLDTQHGRDMFTTVKELGPLGQWSYSYDAESERGEFDGKNVRFLKGLHVHEASPVLVGAGIGTSTVAAKAEKPFPEQFETVLGDVTALIDRAKAWGLSEDAKAGRVLSSANHQRLTGLAERLLEAHSALTEMLAENDPEKHRNALISEYARWQHTIAATR